MFYIVWLIWLCFKRFFLSLVLINLFTFARTSCLQITSIGKNVIRRKIVFNSIRWLKGKKQRRISSRATIQVIITCIWSLIIMVVHVFFFINGTVKNLYSTEDSIRQFFSPIDKSFVDKKSFLDLCLSQVVLRSFSKSIFFWNFDDHVI